MGKRKEPSEVQNDFLALSYDKSSDEKSQTKPQPQVIEATIVEEKSELELWQEKINREWEEINKQETAVLILAKQIKEKKKLLQDEQEKLWNEQHMPLLQILANLPEKIEKKE